MSNEIVKISEKAIMPFLQPKQADLIKMIGEIQLKKETSFALQSCQSNNLLAQASPSSIAKCIWNTAITGLTLNPILKLAYITPRRDKNDNWEAILMPSYQGLTKLITDTGSVKNIYAFPVYKGDDYKITYGTDISIYHEPKFKTFAEEDLIVVYAVAILLDGTKQVETMGADEVNSIRARSDGYRAYKSGKAKTAIWVSDYGEMARKTVVKRIAKYLPKTDVHKWNKVAEAINIDNFDYDATEGQLGYIESLISTSGYNDEQRKEIADRLQSNLTIGEAESLIDNLKNNQLNAIQAGNNYSQADIINQVNSK